MPTSSPSPKSDERALSCETPKLERLADECFGPMLKLARSLIRGFGLRGVIDAESSANAALHELYEAASAGKLAEFDDSDGLRRYARRLITQRILDERRRLRTVKRGGSGRAPSDTVGSEELVVNRGLVLADVDLESLQSRRISAEEHIIGMMEVEHLIDELGEPLLKKIARLRFEEYTDQEIAEKTGLARSSVHRKLQKIRAIWRESGLER
jgi:RNA polymerase sigma factor (sigma-70 family)